MNNQKIVRASNISCSLEIAILNSPNNNLEKAEVLRNELALRVAILNQRELSDKKAI
ncbi:hypothetical protein DB41_KV00030 [Neochlamydia sp. TUME1]|uniref:hypothetical protein n=1 Tax=Neochlamydia sp. TUME1 TaxID=1478174 RepID=UPI000582FF96|nr:hypothetical protein [Neochlamydia sp. TUME1]KIC72091.1 hypothetical protein DB41_KV00030 [Neochlamydia sp. TUME1]